LRIIARMPGGFRLEVQRLKRIGSRPPKDRYKDLEYDWERAHLENSRDLVFKSTSRDIETILTLGNENGTRFACAAEEAARAVSASGRGRRSRLGSGVAGNRRG
jgi:uncharacterized protein (DUF849 family)